MPEASNRITPPTQDDDREPAPSGIHYLSAYAITVCGFYTAFVGLGIEEPLFLIVVLALSTVGFLVSYTTRNLPSSGWSIAALVGSVMGALMLRAVSGSSAEALFPAATEGAVHRSLGAFLCWLLVLLSYAQLSSGWLLFMCVPTAAIMGIAGTTSSEPVILWSWAFFILVSTFMLVHDSHARLLARRHLRRSPPSLEMRLVVQIYIAAACSIGAMVTGRILSQPMDILGSAIGPLGGAVSARPTQTASETPTAVGVTESTALPVGAQSDSRDDTVILRIRAAHGAYWRGATYDEYNGRGWNSSLSGWPVEFADRPTSTRMLLDGRLWPSRDVVVPEGELNAVPARSHTLQQYVRVESTARLDTLYAAAEARLFRLRAGDLRYAWYTGRRCTVDESGSVRLPNEISNTGYVAVSEVADWTEDSLRKSRAVLTIEEADAYTSLNVEKEVRQRLREVAISVTKDQTSDYDRIVALKRYLGKQCVYNALATSSADETEDAVIQFLFHTRSGTCQHFATSLAVLCRTIGIPSRVASGFAPGTPNAAGTEFIVRARDKHLWTEVWFAGVGWVPFEATEDALDVTPQSALDRIRASQGWIRNVLRRNVLSALLGTGALLLVLYVVLREVLNRRANRGRTAPGVSIHGAYVLMAYASMNKRLRRWKLERRLHETPEEHAARLRRRLGSAGIECPELAELTNLVERARYAGDAMCMADAKRARRLASMIAEKARDAAAMPVRRLKVEVAGS